MDLMTDNGGGGDTTALEMRVEANETAIETLEAAALIEDYFFVNTGIVGFLESNDERDLVPEFCVSEDGYLIVNLTINYTSTSDATPEIFTIIYVNGSVVAESFVDDE